MKKLLILPLLFCFALLAGQTIDNSDESITINYPSDSVLVVMKSGVLSIKADEINRNLVYIDQGTAVRDKVRLLPSDFGYTTPSALISYLNVLCGRGYVVKMNQATNPDTMFYLSVDLADTISYRRMVYNATGDTILYVYPVTKW